MAPVIGFIGLAASAFMSYQSYEQQKDAAKTAERIGIMNAANIEAETHEEARRLKENQKRALAEATALGAASGVAGGSQDIYLEDMADLQESELEWLKKSGASRSEIARMEGAHARQQGEAMAMGSLVDTVKYGTEAAQTGYSYGKKQSWWGT